MIVSSGKSILIGRSLGAEHPGAGACGYTCDQGLVLCLEWGPWCMPARNSHFSSHTSSLGATVLGGRSPGSASPKEEVTAPQTSGPSPRSDGELRGEAGLGDPPPTPPFPLRPWKVTLCSEALPAGHRAINPCACSSTLAYPRPWDERAGPHLWQALFLPLLQPQPLSRKGAARPRAAQPLQVTVCQPCLCANLASAPPPACVCEWSGRASGWEGPGQPGPVAACKDESSPGWRAGWTVTQIMAGP